MNDARLYIALTSRDLNRVEELFDRLRGLPVGMKVGLELFVRRGAGLLEEITKAGFPLFLDLKFHDIPFTVAGAVRSACRFGPSLLNVHAWGGMEMMRAAADAASEGTRVLAVTLLTSLDDEDMALLGVEGTPLSAVVRLAGLAAESGLSGVVCSPFEAEAVRKAAGSDFLIVTPGIRPAGSASNDQKRVATPAMAVAWGASALVVGRPITQAENPEESVLRILREMDSAEV